MPPAPYLPDALVRFPPVPTDPVDETDDVDLQVVRDGCAVLVIELNRVDQLAVDVELQMGVSQVADADWPRTLVALQVREPLLPLQDDTPRGLPRSGVHSGGLPDGREVRDWASE